MFQPPPTRSLAAGAISSALLLSCGACAGVSSAPEVHPEPTAPEASAPEAAVPQAPVAASAAVQEAAVPQGPSADELASYGMPYQMIEGEPMFTVLAQDGIPAIDNPTFVPAEEAMDWMDLDETVLGVVGKNGTAKCYSAWLLDSHEIVNDEIDGAPITATW